MLDAETVPLWRAPNLLQKGRRGNVDAEFGPLGGWSPSPQCKMESAYRAPSAGAKGSGLRGGPTASSVSTEPQYTICITLASCLGRNADGRGLGVQIVNLKE